MRRTRPPANEAWTNIDTEDFRFVTAGGRLIAVRHAKEVKGSGAGHSSQGTSVITVRLQIKEDG